MATNLAGLEPVGAVLPSSKLSIFVPSQVTIPLVLYHARDILW